MMTGLYAQPFTRRQKRLQYEITRGQREQVEKEMRKKQSLFFDLRLFG